MNICGDSVRLLQNLLGDDEAFKAIHLAKKAQTLEDKWRSRSEHLFNKVSTQIAEDLLKGLNPDLNKIDFEMFYVEQFFDVAFEAMESASERLPPIKSKQVAKMAYPKGKMPRTLKDLMTLWDQWRKKKTVPKRQQKIAQKVKKSYINKIQQVVKKYQEKIGRGEVIEKKEIVDYIRDHSKAEAARAKTIVETETSRYWNQIRKNVYDESEDVTHYLFMPIRDMATTKWCNSRRGLVYAKGDPLLEKETPPIHWNCRSEILPLTPQNPKHLRIIEDKSRWRRNHSPEPLPPGWNK